MIPPIVYLPKRLRMDNQAAHDRQHPVDDGAADHQGEPHPDRGRGPDRVPGRAAKRATDPLVPDHVSNGSIEVHYEIPTIEQRERVAQFLCHKVTLRNGSASAREASKPVDDWNNIVEQREEAIRARGQG
jgi:hypothetical protein